MANETCPYKAVPCITEKLVLLIAILRLVSPIIYISVFEGRNVNLDWPIVSGMSCQLRV
jgi:hypothetical protein